MFDYRKHASALSLTRKSEMLGHPVAGPDELRARAARYRSLAETLVDSRVIAVVQACARELEMEAILVASADAA